MLEGIWVPFVTPFDRRERVDASRLEDLLVLLAGAPLSGFVALGSTGEAPLLSESERDQVIRVARRTLPRHPLLVGAGGESTRLAVERTRRAAALGADGVLVLAPGFYRSAVGTREIVAHFRAVVEASQVPVFLYQFPQANGFLFPPGSVRSLRRVRGIAGMKDSLGETDSIQRWVEEGGGAFDVAVGSARHLLSGLDAGAAGGILAVANFAPGLCRAVYEARRAGERATAERLQARLSRLASVAAPMGPAGCKAALELLGFPVGGPRGPLAGPSPRTRAALRKALREAGGRL
jgi:dihydrodipicolinate synthase/N-acetylneuraminate lyase